MKPVLFAKFALFHFCIFLISNFAKVCFIHEKISWIKIWKRAKMISKKENTKRAVWVISVIIAINGLMVYSAVSPKKNSIAAILSNSKAQANYADTQRYFAGLRRSTYGYDEKNNDHIWWINRAKQFAASLSKETNKSIRFEPAIIEIVSGYNEKNGGSVIGFTKPENYAGNTAAMTFDTTDGINHEKALLLYDSAGISAIIQFEPGSSDLLSNIDMAFMAFGSHKCIIGFGVDAEWYFTKQSKDSTGLPIRDSDAEKWMKKITEYNPKWTLFLKHWEPEHMPKTFRHPNLWFLTDSQIFPSMDSCMDDFKYWGSSYGNSVTGYQYGYPSDAKWWKKLPKPQIAIAQRILQDIPSSRYFFWVDFSAKDINFE